MQFWTKEDEAVHLSLYYLSVKNICELWSQRKLIHRFQFFFFLLYFCTVTRQTYVYVLGFSFSFSLKSENALFQSIRHRPARLSSQSEASSSTPLVIFLIDKLFPQQCFQLSFNSVLKAQKVIWTVKVLILKSLINLELVFFIWSFYLNTFLNFPCCF